MQVCLEDTNDMKLRLIRIPGQFRDREEARERYGIRGNAIDDCVVIMCCRPCALMQEQREIELEERSFE
jgi:Cys-rich protein (TIGR01571 family)